MQELMFLHKIVACSCIGKSKKKKTVQDYFSGTKTTLDWLFSLAIFLIPELWHLSVQSEHTSWLATKNPTESVVSQFLRSILQ